MFGALGNIENTLFSAPLAFEVKLLFVIQPASPLYPVDDTGDTHIFISLSKSKSVISTARSVVYPNGISLIVRILILASVSNAIFMEDS